MNKITRLVVMLAVLVLGIGGILYMYERQQAESNILTELDVHSRSDGCADPAYTLMADWDRDCYQKSWGSYIQELQIQATMGTPLSEITEPQYIMTCTSPNEYYGRTELKAFEKTTGGFEVYFMDGTSVWLSSGNACVIKDFHGD